MQRHDSSGMAGQTSLTTRAPQSGPISISTVAVVIEERLISGEYSPGERLPSERELAGQFGVGRSAIREVLRGLQEKGLIDSQPGRGTFAREVRLTDAHGSVELAIRRGGVTARELVQARTVLECEAAALAAEHRTDEQVDEMRMILSAFNSAPDTGAGAALDLAFHEAIVVASGNQVLQIMFGSIRNLTLGVVLRSLTDRNVRNAGVPIHEQVLNAVSDQDPEAARRAMASHMKAAEPFYGRDLDEPLADVLMKRAATSQPVIAELLLDASKRIDEHRSSPTEEDWGSA